MLNFHHVAGFPRSHHIYQAIANQRKPYNSKLCTVHSTDKKIKLERFTDAICVCVILLGLSKSNSWSYTPNAPTP